MGMRILTIALALLLFPQISVAQAPGTSGRPHNGWTVQAFAQAGFTAVQVAEQIQKPHAVFTNGVYIDDPAHVELQANKRHSISPALSTGLLLWNQGRGRMGAGFGAHAVYLSTGSDTRVVPAVSLHVGELNTHFFIGFLLGPVDRVEFPDGRSSVVVPSDKVPDFVTRQTDTGWQFYGGIVLLGKAIGGKP